MQKLYKILFISVLCSTLCTHLLKAQVFPAGFAQSRVGGGIRVPVAGAVAPDGRAFVVEQTGNVRVIKNNTTLATPFVSLTVDSRGERGLLGIAVDPDFLINKYIYVYYTVPGTPSHNRISRFTATNDTAAPGSETTILDLDPLGAALIHNGGALHFGKDGKLYVAVGENASPSNAQNLNTYLGKLLRINKDGSVPAGNPFPTGSEQQRRVWAYGLRNPFTFAIDQETGKIFVNDVGQDAFEEINDATEPGRNFGWPLTEGPFDQASFPTLSNPVYAYRHGTGDGVGCAIVGGAFISPSNVNYPAEYRGKYLFQDNCNDWINILDLSGPVAVRSPFATSVIRNSMGLTMGIDGFLYFCARHEESLYKIIYNLGVQPTIVNQPISATVAAGQPASFSVSALGTPPLSYQWQKNEANIPGATNATFSIPQTSEGDSGGYRVIVTNSAGNVTSNVATLSVISNELPTAEILTPTSGNTYVAGTTIDFSGRGTDPEDGELAAQSLSWQINFHHNTHHHDEPPRNGISSGSFTIPQVGETSDNVWYRIILTVTDSRGFTGKDSVDVFPLKSTLQFNTVPAGLQITLDGQPFTTPGSVVSVEGVLRSIGVLSPQTLNGETYEFVSWSDGGALTHDIETPSDDATYTATFIRAQNSFYRAVNINGPALSIDGNNWESSTGAQNFSMTGQVFASQDVTLNPSTDGSRASMIRSSLWYQPNVTINAVPAGTYQVWVYVWEDNFPVTYSIQLEGNVVESNYNSGGAGTWRKLGPFTASINDGNINVSSAGIDANISGIEIWRADQSVGNPEVTTPLVDQNGVVGTPFSYTFASNTFTASQPGNTLTYSASLNDGAALPGWLTFSPATRTFGGTPDATQIGSIDIKVTASEASGTISDVFTLNITGATEATFYRAININGPALAIDGNNWEASTGASNFSMNGIAFANENVTLNPATDATRASMIRSSIWYQPSITINAVPAGSYQVWLYVWEDNSPVTYSVVLEGNVVQSNYNSTGEGVWKKLGPFSATIDDGSINITSSGLEANFSGVEIWRAGQSVGSPTVANPLVDQNATAGSPFSYTFAVNTFAPSQAGSTLSYAASLGDGSSLPAWLTFNAATRTFSGTPQGTHVGSVDVRVTATEGAATINDVFALNVSSAPVATFYRAININGPALSIDGNSWEASAGAPNFTMNGIAFANQGVTLNPATDANRTSMIRSSIWYQPSVSINAVPPGNYQVWAYVWEDNFPVTYSILLEGNVVQSNFNSIGEGVWRKLGPFTATINDGSIDLSAQGLEANFSGIEVWSDGTTSSSGRLATATNSFAGDTLADSGDSAESYELAFYPNPFSGQAKISYRATQTGAASVSMYDVRGLKIWASPSKNMEKGYTDVIEMETSGFQDGVYILEVINGRDVRRLKVIKVR